MIDRLLNQCDPTLASPFVAGALDLRARGVKAMMGVCGVMAIFQPRVAAALDIPVFLSPLRQIPFIAQITGRPVGIITANAARLTPAHFAAFGVDAGSPLRIAGMEGYPEFRSAILEEKGIPDSDLIKAEVCAVARRLVADHPEVGVILLECSDLPPYAQALQQTTGRPVFDFNTMITQVERAVVPRRYRGALWPVFPCFARQPARIMI